jgi:hypothetical protein
VVYTVFQRWWNIWHWKNTIHVLKNQSRLSNTASLHPSCHCFIISCLILPLSHKIYYWCMVKDISCEIKNLQEYFVKSLNWNLIIQKYKIILQLNLFHYNLYVT